MCAARIQRRDRGEGEAAGCSRCTREGEGKTFANCGNRERNRRTDHFVAYAVRHQQQVAGVA